MGARLLVAFNCERSTKVSKTRAGKKKQSGLEAGSEYAISKQNGKVFSAAAGDIKINTKKFENPTAAAKVKTTTTA